MRRCWRATGAKVVHFDPLRDPLPPCDGLIIPGGFPEEHVEDLSSRHDLQDAVRAHVAVGKPVHGECAGLLWLLESLDAYPMLGVIDTHAAMGRRLTLGYRDAVALTDSVLFRAGERITGHEFHHTALTSQEVAGWESAWGWRAWGWPRGCVRVFRGETFTRPTCIATRRRCRRLWNVLFGRALTPEPAHLKLARATRRGLAFRLPWSARGRRGRRHRGHG